MRPLAWAGWVALAVASSAPARAHGPAPAVLEVVQVRDGQAQWLRTSVGLAHRRADGAYDYVCPSRWDGNERARAAAWNRSVLVFSRSLAYLSVDEGCTFDERDLGGAVRGVTATDDGFALLVDDTVVRIDGAGAELSRVDATWQVDAIAWFEGVVLAGREGETAVVDRGGIRAVVGAGVDAVRIRRVDATTLEGVLQRGAEQEVFSLEGDAVRRGPTGQVVVGPLRLADGTGYAVVDGVRYVDSSGWREDEPAPWTCLQELDGRAYACSLDGLFEVGADFSVTPRFRFAQLGEPECSAVDACDLDWAHFGGESGWLDTDPATDPDEARRPRDEGCAVASGTLVLPFAVLLLWRRRRASS